MAYEKSEEWRLSQTQISGYEGEIDSLVSAARISGATSSNIWATGEDVNITVIVNSGSRVSEWNAEDLGYDTWSIDSEKYNPYYIYWSATASGITVSNPSWEIYCSGTLPPGCWDAVQEEQISGLTESGMRDVLYKYLGKFNVYLHMARTGRFSHAVPSGWFLT